MFKNNAIKLACNRTIIVSFMIRFTSNSHSFYQNEWFKQYFEKRNSIFLYLAQQQGTEGRCETGWHWQGNPQVMARAHVCLVGGVMYGERKATGQDCSARLDCWTPLRCWRLGSGLPLHQWAGHRWNQTDPKREVQHRVIYIKIKFAFFPDMQFCNKETQFR